MMLHKNDYPIVNKCINFDLINHKDILKKINHEIINYYFHRTKLGERIIESVEIRRVRGDDVLLQVNMIPTGKIGSRNTMVLNIFLSKIIKRDRDIKLNELFND